MFGLRKRLVDLTADEVEGGLARKEYALVDVREAAEFAAERVAGSVLMPLSAFVPAGLPQDGRAIVLMCAAGRRSAMAAQMCAQAGVEIAGHLTDGIAGWRRAGLPTVRG